MKKVSTKSTKQKVIDKEVGKNKKISSFFVKKPSDSTIKNTPVESSLEKSDSKNKRKVVELEEKCNSEHTNKLRKVEQNNSKFTKSDKNLPQECTVEKNGFTNDSDSLNQSSDLLSSHVLKEKIVYDEDSGILSKFSSIDENVNGNSLRDSQNQNGILSEINKENNLDNKIIPCDKVAKSNFNATDFEDEIDSFFSDGWDEDFVENNLDLSELTRCIVLDVSKSGKDVILSLKDSISEEKASVRCSDYWVNVEVGKGKIIVIQATKSNDEWIINNNTGLLIIQPDLLISGTTVVGGLFCNRQTILREKFRGFESLPFFKSSGPYMTVGVLVHNILQTALDSKVETLPEIKKIYEKIIQSFNAISLMYQCGMTIEDCRTQVEPYLPQICNFIQRYMKEKPGPAKNKNFEGQIDTIRDIEENIWLPKMGLKGKIDVSVEVKINSKRRIMPLELKTGKTSFSPEHRGQVILYTMMMSMIGQKVDSGLLLYLKENEMKEIKGSHHEKRDLILLRNTLSLYLSKKSNVNVDNFDDIKEALLDLPEPINHRSACSSCSVNYLCSMYLIHDEKFRLKDSSHPLKQVTEKLLSHLKLEHIHYVMKWVKLLQIEEEVDRENSSMKNIWTMEPSKREKKGSCICNLKMVHVEKKEDYYSHTFKRNEKLEGALSDFTLSEIHDSDYVVINTAERVNIAAGYIHEISQDSVTVLLDRNLSVRYPGLTFHVDKYFSGNISQYNRAAVSGLLIDDEVCSRLRSIIIEKEPATFKDHLPRSIAPISAPILGRLNKQQQRAIFKILTAREYALLKGMPGTGKTRTLVALVELLVRIKKSVLITANTHSAVDNILIGLKEKGIDFLRLGTKTKIHPSLAEYTEAAVTAECKTPESLRDAYASKNVVGVTCLGAYHKLFESRKFDVCLVDESTQAQQCAVLKPLYNSAKFVLVGDPEQLPPIARSEVARKLGYNESLFTRLDSENNTIVLFSQYRMNNEIMTLANKITYKDQLKAGTEEHANATLLLRNRQVPQSWWIQAALSVKIEDSVIFLNTFIPEDLESGFENIKKNSKPYCNQFEAALVQNLVKTLLEMGLNEEEIGVIAPFRAQVNLLGKAVPQDVEVNTVDQYQGREKNIIIYSCTESSPQGCANTRAFHILDDHNRLTVAVTRAKHKLIMIGDKNILKSYLPFQKLLLSMREENIIDLFDPSKSFDWNEMIDSYKSKLDSN